MRHSPSTLNQPRAQPRPRITLVLLPGMDGTGELFEPFIVALGASCKVIVVRYPGDRPMDYAQLVERARAALPPRGPFVILGESFSGPVAVSLAASCTTARLKGLILCCSFVRSPQPLLAGLAPLAGLLPVKQVPAHLSAGVLLGRWSSAAWRAALRSALAQVTAATLGARMRAVMTVDMAEEFRRVPVPVLALRSARDRVVPSSATRMMAQLRPDTRVVTLDAPHFLLQAVPLEAARAVGQFLRGVQPVA